MVFNNTSLETSCINFNIQGVDTRVTPASISGTTCPYGSILPTLTNVTFTGNTAEGAGALFFFESRSSHFTKCSMTDFCPATGFNYCSMIGSETFENLASRMAGEQ